MDGLHFQSVGLLLAMVVPVVLCSLSEHNHFCLEWPSSLESRAGQRLLSPAAAQNATGRPTAGRDAHRRGSYVILAAKIVCQA